MKNRSDQEYNFLSHFIQCIEKDFCDIKSREPEQDPPDFYLTLDGEEIALEITQIMIQKDAIFNKECNRVVDRLNKDPQIVDKNQETSYGIYFMENDINFKTGYEVLVSDILSMLENQSFCPKTKGLSIFPANKRKPHIFLRPATMNESFWDYEIKPFLEKEIQNAIKKKESKMKNISGKKWLLIPINFSQIEDEDINNVIAKLRIQTTFDKVYFIWRWEGTHLYELPHVDNPS